MKKIFLTLALSSLLAGGALAEEIPAGNKPASDILVSINQISQEGSTMDVDLQLNLSQVNFQRNRQAIYTPIFVNGTDTAFMSPFSMAGHNRYIWALRNGQLAPILMKGYGSHRGELSKESVPQGPGYALIGEPFQTVDYNYALSIPYQPWMEVSTLYMKVEDIGCSDCGSTINYYPLAQIDFRPAEFEADFIYVTPVAEEIKTRELSGRAFVDFVVNKTNILPDYRNNKVELGKIIATIDSVKNDKDITVTSITISGTASPEGSYENNVRLAKGRTEALVEYVRKLYNFPEGFIKTSYEPVDWKGLKEWLENNEIENRNEILAIVDGDLEPYARNQKIKTTYPKQYQYLLQNVYPALRHSDYVIEYNIRKFKDVDEIIEVMLTSPQKLSLNELFLVSNSQPEGSELYNKAFELAAVLYSNDEVANLNAGTNAIKRGDYVGARNYLSKAGKHEEAEYTRAVLEALDGDKEAALKKFEYLAKNAKNETVRQKAAAEAQSLANSMQKAGRKYVP